MHAHATIAFALFVLVPVRPVASQTPAPAAGSLAWSAAVQRGVPGRDYCAARETLLFRLETARGKIAAVCLHPLPERADGGTPDPWLVYRFGTRDRVELAFPSDTGGPPSAFLFSYYRRPGGAENEGREEGDLQFTVGDFEYHVYYGFAASDGHESYGVRVRNRPARTTTDIRGVRYRGSFREIQERLRWPE